jgi:DNA adenine methylase
MPFDPKSANCSMGSALNFKSVSRNYLTPIQSLLAQRKREATAARFIFYPGQKGTMIERIATLIPKNATRLIEPFTGSASVPAALTFRFREILCSDALPSVIEAHQRAITDPDGFCADIQSLFDQPAPDPEARFNSVRKHYNATNTPLKIKAALLIYLNRKAALGLVRHDEDGEFSASWHESKIGNAPPLEAIRKFSKRLSGKATFTLQDFRTAIALAGPGDFVYCDPPYLPEEGKKITFTGYSTAFGVQDHIDLAALARAAADRGAKVVVSNHDSEFIRATYASADSITALAVERKAGRKKGEAAKTSAKEILAVWSPKITDELAVKTSLPKRLRRESALIHTTRMPISAPLSAGSSSLLRQTDGPRAGLTLTTLTSGLLINPAAICYRWRVRERRSCAFGARPRRTGNPSIASSPGKTMHRN